MQGGQNPLYELASCGWLADRLAGCLPDWLTGRLAGCLAAWLAAACMAGKLSFLSVVFGNIEILVKEHQRIEYLQEHAVKLQYCEKGRIRERTKMWCFPSEIQQT